MTTPKTQSWRNNILL